MDQKERLFIKNKDKTVSYFKEVRSLEKLIVLKLRKKENISKYGKQNRFLYSKIKRLFGQQKFSTFKTSSKINYYIYFKVGNKLFRTETKVCL